MCIIIEIDLFSTFGLKQYITTPTQKSGGVLELLFTNVADPFTFSLPVYFTDHHFIAASYHDT